MELVNNAKSLYALFLCCGYDALCGAAVALLGSDAKVETRGEGDALVIVPPALAPSAMPCEHAWVYRIGK